MQQPQRPLLALALRVAAALVLSTGFLLTKLLGQRGVVVPEMIFWRQLIGVALLASWLARAGKLGRLRTHRPGAHLVRASLGMASMGVNLWAFQILHLSEATTLSFTTPLFVVLLTALLLSETVGAARWLAVGIGFAGVLLISRPDSAGMPPLGIALALISAALNALISFQIRDLARTEAPITVVFWFTAFGVVYAAPALPFTYHHHDATVWLMLAALGGTGVTGQWLLTAALRHGAVASVVVMDYTQLLWATLYGWLIWDEMPGASLWLGAPLIVGSGLIIAWHGHVQARQPGRDEPAA